MAGEPFLVQAIQFLDQLGLYDTLLPFLLVFTIIFAVLEKSRIFGTEKIGGEEMPRKNLNAMTAFVIGFIVIASTNLVAAINEAVANMILLLILAFSFLLLVASFSEQKENKPFYLEGAMKWIFVVIMFVGVILIFLHALKIESDLCPGGGQCTWLDVTWGFLTGSWNSALVGSVILLAIIGLFIWYITKGDGGGNGEKSSGDT